MTMSSEITENLVKASDVRALVAGLRPLLWAAGSATIVPAITIDRFDSLVTLLRPLLQNAARQPDLAGLWSAARVRRRELRNCSVLAWLIKPRAEHGNGLACLSALVTAAATKLCAWSPDDLALDQARISVEQRPLSSDRDRVDIAIDGPGYAFFVEVKVDADEGWQQLPRYIETLKSKVEIRGPEAAASHRLIVIYISPRPPRAVSPGLVHLSWVDVSKALIAASDEAEPQVAWLIRSFALHVRAFG